MNRTGVAVCSVSADHLEERICGEAIRRVALIDPFLSVIMAMAIESDSADG